MAQTKTFGLRGEKLKDILKDLESRGNSSDASKIRNIHSHLDGTIHRDPTMNFSPKAKKRIEDFMAFQSSTKIALGTAQISNFSQSLISSILDAGYYRYFKGLNSLRDPKVIEFLKKSGAVEWNMLTEFVGNAAPAGSTSSKIADFLSRKSGFTGMNKVNQWTAAAAGRIFIKDLYKIANSSTVNLRKKWAQNKLDGLGINYKQFDNLQFKLGKGKKISDDMLMRGVNKFARETQLQRDILKDPVIYNNPQTQVFFQFKRFGLNQSKLIDKVLRADLKKGNVTSLLRLGLAGVAGGSLTITAKQLFKELISGKEIYDPESGMELPEDLEGLINNLSAVGSLGMMGDILNSVVDVTGSPTRTAKFLALPAFWSDVENVTKFMQAVEQDASKFGVDFIHRVPARLGKVLGTVPRLASQRFETVGQQEERLEGRKRFAVRDINKLIDANQYSKAMSRVRLWNKTHRKDPISGRSISFESILKRKAKKTKAKVKNRLKKQEDIESFVNWSKGILK